MVNRPRTHGNELGISAISIGFAMDVATRLFFVPTPGPHGGMTSSHNNAVTAKSLPPKELRTVTAFWSDFT
jgi:hypothetical protein